MKYSRSLYLLMLFANYSFGQSSFSVYSLPSKFNNFISDSSINWAAEVEDSFSFLNSTPIKSKNIYDYLASLTSAGKLLTHINEFDDFDGFEKANFSRYDNYSFATISDSDLTFILSDSSKKIQFHEYLYLENFALKSRIVSAAPMANYAASGFSLGSRQIFYCCQQINDSISANDSKPIYLKQVSRIFNLDSLSNFRLLKQTFGLNLIQALWYGVSLGKNKVINLLTNKAIQSSNVMLFTLDNSKGAYAIFPHKFANQIEIIEDYYFDVKSNSFSSIIKYCYLFTKGWDDQNFVPLRNKVFKITF